MIDDGKITKLIPHPFKEGYYIGEIVTDGGMGCNFEMNPRRVRDICTRFPETLKERGLCGLVLVMKCWVEIDGSTFKVLDWGI